MIIHTYARAMFWDHDCTVSLSLLKSVLQIISIKIYMTLHRVYDQPITYRGPESAPVPGTAGPEVESSW